MGQESCAENLNIFRFRTFNIQVFIKPMLKGVG